MLGGGALGQLIVYGKFNPAFPQYTHNDRVVPLLAWLYDRFLWWTVWSATEDLTHNGYALPRLVVLTRSHWLSVAIVLFFFALHHSFLMLAGWKFFVHIFLTFVPLSVAMLAPICGFAPASAHRGALSDGPIERVASVSG